MDTQTLPYIEPFRIKLIEPIRQISRVEREQILARADYNLYNIQSEHIFIDLLTDSGLCALSASQAAAMTQADESYAGSSSHGRFDQAVRDIFGFDYIVPTHQGRAAERLLVQSLSTPGQSVPGNAHYDTTRANLLAFGVTPVDLPVEEFWEFEKPALFKGNMDVAALEELLQNDLLRRQVPFILLTVTNNVCGDQPVSLQNMREIRAIASKYNIPLYLDACRFAQNAWFIHEGEAGYNNCSIRAIVREMFSYADGCIFSAKKDALSHSGGFFATRSEAVAQRAKELLILSEGYITYGGITGRDLDSVALGLYEALEEDYLRYRIETTNYLLKALRAEGLPAIVPAGGHAVYIDVAKLLPHLTEADNPGQAFSAAIYLDGGIRSTRIKFQSNSRHAEFVRLALPSRVYTTKHLDYVANVLGKVAQQAGSIRGLRTVFMPKLLGGFLARYEPCPASDPASHPARQEPVEAKEALV